MAKRSRRRRTQTLETYQWLTFGLDANNQLISIEDSPRGKTDLCCPYCGSPLTAKKGKVKTWHFAHQENSCRFIERPEISLPTLPCYDRFNLYLTPTELQRLSRLWNGWGQAGLTIPREKGLMTLTLKGFLRRLVEPEVAYQFTRQGKIPFGALSLKAFCQFQEPLMKEKLQQLQQAMTLATERQSPDVRDRTIDYQLYLAQYQRIYQQTLYFLDVRVDGQQLHKIGVTTRSLPQRIAEVKQDLKQHYQDVEVKALGTWPHRGNIELYFKHRYGGFNYPIGSLTEYFQFSQVKAVLTDLQGIQSV